MSNADVLAKLREPFPRSKVGKLPKITCSACSKASSKACEQHRKARCGTCQNYITSSHTHLDYVGHAEVTRRLLDVDPLWTWQPMAFDDAGLPAIDSAGGMWITLTVGNVTRIGYGDAQGKSGGNAVKEVIGDAIRNAAMRFGVALDLWSKERDEDAYIAEEGTPPPLPEPEKSYAEYYAMIHAAGDSVTLTKVGTEFVKASALSESDRAALRAEFNTRATELRRSKP